MKNCTKHFMKRWVERVVNIKDDKEVQNYIAKNKDQIVAHANATFEYAEHIFTGQIGDNVTRNYHIKDDLVFVTNMTNDAFVTLVTVDLGLPKHLNTQVRKGLIDEIRGLMEDKENIELEIEEEVENKEAEIESTNEQIKILEEQLKNLKEENKFREDEIKSIKKKSFNTNLEIKRYALMLVNSKQYKNDLQNIK